MVNNINTKISLAILLAVNLFTLFGIVALGWDSTLILLAYWAESGIIGFFTIFKMILAKGKTNIIKKQFIAFWPNKDPTLLSHEVSVPVMAGIKAFQIIFFIIHFGIFMLGHLFFILFVGSFFLKIDFPSIPNFLALFTALFVSHGISFYLNYIKEKEYLRATSASLMTAPYKRIIAMHFAIIIGAFAGVSAAILIIIKTLIDSLYHIKEHKI